MPTAYNKVVEQGRIRVGRFKAKPHSVKTYKSTITYTVSYIVDLNKDFGPEYIKCWVCKAKATEPKAAPTWCRECFEDIRKRFQNQEKCSTSKTF